jgi:tryptophanyl-tRNA synthetase
VLGCVACKQNCANKIADFFAPLREKRQYYEQHMDEVWDVLNEGTKKAKAVAEKTMDDVHKAMKMG